MLVYTADLWLRLSSPDVPVLAPLVWCHADPVCGGLSPFYRSLCSTRVTAEKRQDATEVRRQRSALPNDLLI